MPKITRLPREDSTNGWSRILPARPPKPALDTDVRSDWLVVGAGFAGLAAARHLAENNPNDRIVLLEAHEVGENASGRNSGFVIDLPHDLGASLAESEASHRYIRLSRAAIGFLDGTVQKHAIACDWARKGKYHAAVTERGVREVLEPYAKQLEALGEPFEWVDKEGVREKIGSSHFSAAIYTPGCILVNPAALTRGLADSLPENVSLHEYSPVIEVDSRNGVTVATPNGSVRAPKLILATNGFAERFGVFRHRLLHMVAYGSLTRPLSEREQEAFGVAEDWGLTPAKTFVSITMRYTADRRILIRHGVGFCPSQRIAESKRRKVARRHKELFDARFPMLKDVALDYTWSGFVCLSWNGAPGFGQVAPNVWAAVCQNAVGATKGTISGVLAADLASGVASPLIADMASLGTPRRMPPRPFLDLGVGARFGWEIWRNRHEA